MTFLWTDSTHYCCECTDELIIGTHRMKTQCGFPSHRRGFCTKRNTFVHICKTHAQFPCENLRQDNLNEIELALNTLSKEVEKDENCSHSCCF
jgi:hypothetical protein